MNHPRTNQLLLPRRSGLVVAVGLLLFLLAGSAGAQTIEPVSVPASGPVRVTNLRRAIEHLRFDAATLNAFDAPASSGQTQPASKPQQKEMSLGGKVLLGAACAVGGFFAGGFTGLLIDSQAGGLSGGADSGLAAFVIGGYSGAIVLPIVALTLVK